MDNTDPIEYWLNQQVTYPLLISVAIDILSIPRSSAPVERVFSTAGDSTIGKRNRLSDHNLEQEVLLKKNKHFFVVYYSNAVSRHYWLVATSDHRG